MPTIERQKATASANRVETLPQDRYVIPTARYAIAHIPIPSHPNPARDSLPAQTALWIDKFQHLLTSFPPRPENRPSSRLVCASPSTLHLLLWEWLACSYFADLTTVLGNELVLALVRSSGELGRRARARACEASRHDQEFELGWAYSQITHSNGCSKEYGFRPISSTPKGQGRHKPLVCSACMRGWGELKDSD